MNRIVPPAVKALLIANIAMFVLTLFFQTQGIYLIKYLSLYDVTSPYFHIYQVITHMFMHAGPEHIFFNMFALWMFGSMLENVWGSNRFLFFYFFCGIGAAIIQLLSMSFNVWHLHEVLNTFLSHPSPASFDSLIGKYYDALSASRSDDYTQISGAYKANPSDSTPAILFATDFFEKLISQIRDIPTLGASGAVFGLLAAFGYLFPNTELFLMFIPIPIKAKYFVLGYAALELFFGLSGNEPGVAHFAHLGGGLFGFLLVLYWNRKGKTFY